MGHPRSLRIEIPERVTSWNKFYEQKHWRSRQREAHFVHAMVREKLDPDMDPLKAPVHVRFIALYHSHPVDVDNVTVKLYVDGLIPIVLDDDNYHHVPDLSVHTRKWGRDAAVIIVSELHEMTDLTEYLVDKEELV